VDGVKGQPRDAAVGLRAQDYVRGVLIAIISAVAGYWILVPEAEGAARGAMSSRGVAMVAVGVALQLGVIGGNWLVARYERAHGLQGQLAPTARHILQLLADGVSVLLFALAVFGGIVGAANSI
jgi:hypothetical protein